MTPDFDSGATLADRMRVHAGERRHLYGYLMRAMADDWEARGPVREICTGWERAPEGAVVQLRLLAGLFRIVLTGRAPQLVRFYPCLGGHDHPAQAWPVARPVLSRYVDELHAALEVAPQTNEVGRSTALLVGLFDVVRRSGLRRVRLLEPGASAGLNLLVDKYRFVNSGWSFGPMESPLELRDGVVGDVQPEPFDIVDRRGCDLAPVDPASPDGQLRLRSFVWPFQIDRHDRLTSALEIASSNPPVVDRSPAGEWLAARLDDAMSGEVLTVVWQSITRMYWPADETAWVEDVLRRAARRIPLAHIAMEFPPWGTQGGAQLIVDGTDFWDARTGGGPTLLGSVGDHGIPVTLAA